MDLMIILGALFAIGYYAYRNGKRTGSRKGYHVGRTSRRRSR